MGKMMKNKLILTVCTVLLFSVVGIAQAGEEGSVDGNSFFLGLQYRRQMSLQDRVLRLEADIDAVDADLETGNREVQRCLGLAISGGENSENWRDLQVVSCLEKSSEILKNAVQLMQTRDLKRSELARTKTLLEDTEKEIANLNGAASGSDQ